MRRSRPTSVCCCISTTWSTSNYVQLKRHISTTKWNCLTAKVRENCSFILFVNLHISITRGYCLCLYVPWRRRHWCLDPLPITATCQSVICVQTSVLLTDGPIPDLNDFLPSLGLTVRLKEWTEPEYWLPAVRVVRHSKCSVRTARELSLRCPSIDYSLWLQTSLHWWWVFSTRLKQISIQNGESNRIE